VAVTPASSESSIRVVRFGLAPRRPGLTTAEFVELWAEHGVRSRRAGRPGRLSYIQNFPVLEAGRHLLPYPGFDVCAEATYESMQAIEAAFAPGGSVGLDADRYSLLDATAFNAVTARRHVVIDGPTTAGSVKLMTFYRSHPLHGPGALSERLMGGHAQIVAQISPMRHEVLLANSSEPRQWDAVEIIWFDSSTDALDYTRSDTAYNAAVALGGRCFGTERLIARPVFEGEDATHGQR
jgi:hypothetical protein